MAYELRFQDPAATGTRYLYEAIIELFLDRQVTVVEAVFAFASYHGAISLAEDPAFEAFLRRGGTFRLLVGLDAVTDRRALEVLRDAARKYDPHFEVRVFKSEQPGLFHPKVVRTVRDDGAGCLIVGSGNLTPGGLRGNVEAYSVLRYEPGASPDQTEWDRFLADHGGEISEIDDDALERGDRNAERVSLGRRNVRRRVRVRRGARPPHPEAVAEELAAAGEVVTTLEEAAAPPQPTDRMFVAAVPAAGPRWHQVHFNVAAIRRYFRARPRTADRVYLFRWEPPGMVVQEPPRPVVFSRANVNHKIEFGARAGQAYPTGGPPVIVARELGLRTHLYLMLFPGEPGYSEVSDLLASYPRIGPGMPRVITTRASVVAAWPGLPI